MFWQPVYQSADLTVGRPLPLRVMGEDFTLYRGESGAAHVIAPTCPHRGVALSAGRVVDDCVECFYHGWTFTGDGQCVAQPAEPKSFADKIRVAAYPTREYLGFVFAYFGEGEPPELPVLDAFEQEGTIERRENLRPWPFFTQLENSVDESHFNFTHRRTKFDDIGMNDEMPILSCEETEYGFVRVGKRGNAVRKGHFLMPNWSLSSNYEHDKGWAEHLVWRVPIDDKTHRSFMADFVYKTGADADAYKKKRAAARERLKTLEPAMTVVKRILGGELHADDVPADRPDIVLIQDAIACMSQGLARNREADRLGASDRQVVMLRSLWTRELRALRESRPIKAWRVPKDLATTKGVEEPA
jgi:5,5'-dehydrodivanillate O-demethylase